jgi:ERCC4-related helicase
MVVSTVMQAQDRFRVLALSATPGNDLQAVQTVITHLAIAQLEVRDETALDVQPHLNTRSVEVIAVDVSPEMEVVRKPFAEVYERVLTALFTRKVIFSKVAVDSFF